MGGRSTEGKHFIIRRDDGAIFSGFVAGWPHFDRENSTRDNGMIWYSRQDAERAQNEIYEFGVDWTVEIEQRVPQERLE